MLNYPEMKEKLLLLFGYSKGGISHDRNSLILILLSLLSIIAVTAFEIYYLENGLYNFQIGGLAVFIFGAIIRTISRLQLGKLFTFNVKIMPNHHVKKDGIYAYMRHPGYAGLILEVLGWVIFFNTWLGTIAAAAFFLPSMFYRINVEEKTLKENFGKEYEEYSNNVKALIPGIY